MKNVRVHLGERSYTIRIGADALGPETLRNPEPDFFILGARSFGKNSAFLMRTGYEQVADAFALLGWNAARTTGAR